MRQDHINQKAILIAEKMNDLPKEEAIIYTRSQLGRWTTYSDKEIDTAIEYLRGKWNKTLSAANAIKAKVLLYQLQARKFDESKHKRDDAGKFSNKDGGGTLSNRAESGTPSKAGGDEKDVDFKPDWTKYKFTERTFEERINAPRFHLGNMDEPTKHTVDKDGNFVPDPRVEATREGNYFIRNWTGGLLDIKPGENVREKIFGKDNPANLLNSPYLVPAFMSSREWNSMDTKEKTKLFDLLNRYDSREVVNAFIEQRKIYDKEMESVTKQQWKALTESFDTSHGDVIIEDKGNYKQIKRIRDAWNSTPMAKKGFAKTLIIGPIREKNRFGDTIGFWRGKDKTIKIDTLETRHFTDKEMKGIVEHEVEHGVEDHWPDEQKEWFSKEIRKRRIAPIDSYAKHHRGKQVKKEKGYEKSVRMFESARNALEILYRNNVSDAKTWHTMDTSYPGVTKYLRRHSYPLDSLRSGHVLKEYEYNWENTFEDRFANEMHSIYWEYTEGESSRGGLNKRSMVKMKKLMSDMKKKFGEPTPEPSTKGKVILKEEVLSARTATRVQHMIYQLRAKFDESKHKRDKDGKFSNKEGGGKSLKFNTKDKSKKEKKLPFGIKITAKEKQYDNFEKEWKSKYAKKWDSIIKEGGQARIDALSAILPESSARRLYHMSRVLDNHEFVERNLDKLNEILGTDYKMYYEYSDGDDSSASWDHLFYKGTRNPTREEAEAFAKRANEAVKKRNKKWLADGKGPEEGYVVLGANYKPEDFDNLEKLKDNYYRPSNLEREYYPEEDQLFDHDGIRKFGGSINVHDIQREFKNALLENPSQFFDVLDIGDTDNEKALKRVLDGQAELDAVLRRGRENAKYVWRGTDMDELDGLLEKGFVGGGRLKAVKKRNIKGRVAASFTKDGASMFNDGVMFQYDKEEIGEDRLYPEYYNVFINKDYKGAENIYGNDYTENGHDPVHRFQEEVAMLHNDKIKPKKLKIHIWSGPIKELKLNKKANREKFLEKYSHLGEIIFHEGGDE